MIELVSGPREGGRWLLRPGEKLSFGRTERSDIIIGEDRKLSSSHFEVAVERDSCRVTDLQSTNGTWVEAEKISSRSITNGDEVQAGDSVFVFRIDSRDAYKRTARDADARSDGSDGSTDGGGTAETDIAEPTENPVDGAAVSAGRSNPELPAVSPSHRWKQDEPQSIDVEKAHEPAWQKIEVQLDRSATGLWRGVQQSTSVSCASIMKLLAPNIMPLLIIDFNRTGLTPPEESESASDYLMANLPAEVRPSVSPRMIQAPDAQHCQTLLESGWGSDGMIVLFSTVEVGPLVAHLQSLMRTTNADSGNGRGMIGLCWPSVLSAMLSDGNAKLAASIIEPYDAILLESPDAPGAWTFVGDDRLPQLLDTCNLQVRLVTQ